MPFEVAGCLLYTVRLEFKRSCRKNKERRIARTHEHTQALTHERIATRCPGVANLEDGDFCPTWLKMFVTVG